jgi:hypothetical protein
MFVWDNTGASLLRGFLENAPAGAASDNELNQFLKFLDSIVLRDSVYFNDFEDADVLRRRAEFTGSLEHRFPALNGFFRTKKLQDFDIQLAAGKAALDVIDLLASDEEMQLRALVPDLRTSTWNELGPDQDPDKIFQRDLAVHKLISEGRVSEDEADDIRATCLRNRDGIVCLTLLAHDQELVDRMHGLYTKSASGGWSVEMTSLVATRIRIIANTFYKTVEDSEGSVQIIHEPAASRVPLFRGAASALKNRFLIRLHEGVAGNKTEQDKIEAFLESVEQEGELDFSVAGSIVSRVLEEQKSGDDTILDPLQLFEAALIDREKLSVLRCDAQEYTEASARIFSQSGTAADAANIERIRRAYQTELKRYNSPNFERYARGPIDRIVIFLGKCSEQKAVKGVTKLVDAVATEGAASLIRKGIERYAPSALERHKRACAVQYLKTPELPSVIRMKNALGVAG